MVFTTKQDEFRVMIDRIENFDNGERALQNLDESIKYNERA